MDTEYENLENKMEEADAPITNYAEAEVELTRAASSMTVKHPAPRPSRLVEEDESTRSSDPRSEQEGWLTVDVYQTATEIVIESAVAGVDPDELDITATPDSVSIKGERRREKDVRKEDYLHQECYWGRFSRTVILPQEVDPDSATVHFRNNGVLTIHLPKLIKQKSKKLKISKPQ
jgi:HSP20 family protein